MSARSRKTSSKASSSGVGLLSSARSAFGSRSASAWISAAAALALAAWALAESASERGSTSGAEALGEGSRSRLEIPRFASLRDDRANVRFGPSREHAVAWEFRRRGLPVEITAEYDNWRRIRDSEGDEGWIFHALLSARRTATVAPWSGSVRVSLLSSPDASSPPSATLESGVIGDVRECVEGWCRLRVRADDAVAEGWIRQNLLWGVYPGEAIEN